MENQFSRFQNQLSTNFILACEKMSMVSTTQSPPINVTTTADYNRPSSTTNNLSHTQHHWWRVHHSQPHLAPPLAAHLWRLHTFDYRTPPTTVHLRQPRTSLNSKHTTQLLSPLIFISPSHIYYFINSSPTTIQHALVKVGISYESLLGKTLRNLVQISTTDAWCCARNLHCNGTWVMIGGKKVT